MGKGQKKTGKGRLDKYYKLAKCVSDPKTMLYVPDERRLGSKATVLVQPSSSSS
jgi:hypothetical protein